LEKERVLHQSLFANVMCLVPDALQKKEVEGLFSLMSKMPMEITGIF
jgi:hypothetical protein